MPEVGSLQDCTSCERMKGAEIEIENLKEGQREMDKKLDKLHWWIMSTAAGVAATLIMNLIRGVEK